METKFSTPKMKEITLAAKATLKLTKGLLDQIDYLHNKVGNVEWCGILFYEQLEGELKDPANLVIEARDIYLMDIGSHSYTAGSINGDNVIQMYESIPNADRMRQGLIHTHHTMTTFFSGTDMDELHDNTELHNYYVSLIVNLKGEYTAMLSYIATVNGTSTMTFKNSDDTEITTNFKPTEEKYLICVKLNIEKEARPIDLSSTFQDRFSSVKQEKEKKVVSTSTYGTYGGYAAGYNPLKNSITTVRKQGDIFDELPEEKFKLQKKQISNGATLYSTAGKKISAKASEIYEVVLKWLNAGLSLHESTEHFTGFGSLQKALEFFESHYFTENALHITLKDKFLEGMTRIMPVYFGEYSPKLIEDKMSLLLFNEASEYEVAMDLGNVMGTYDYYMDALSALRVQEEDERDNIESFDSYKKRINKKKSEGKVIKGKNEEEWEKY